MGEKDIIDWGIEQLIQKKGKWKILRIVILLILFQVASYMGDYLAEKVKEIANNHAELQYVETRDDGTIIYQNKNELDDGWLKIQGQLIICGENGKIIKTFLIDDMFEKPSIHVRGRKEFHIKWSEYTIADELDSLLQDYLRDEYDNGEITIKKIGFSVVEIKRPSEESMKPYYYILDGQSMIRIDDETAEAKKKGVHLTNELLNDPVEIEKVLEQTKQEVLEELKKK